MRHTEYWKNAQYCIRNEFRYRLRLDLLNPYLPSRSYAKVDEMKQKRLQSLYKSDPNVHLICEILEEKDRSPTEVKVNGLFPLVLRRNPDATRTGVFGALRKMQECGLGNVFVGRRGFESRFVPAVPAKYIASIARGERNWPPQDVDDDVVTEAEETEESVVTAHRRPHGTASAGKRVSSPKSTVSTKAFTYDMREETPVSFWLPVDMTEKELRGLIAHLCTIQPAKET